MLWTFIKENLATILVSLGGSGIFTFLLNRFFFEKRFEAYKSKLDKKNYIGKMRYDYEFSMYGIMSEALYNVVQDCFWLFPTCLDTIPEDKDKANEVYNNRYKKAHGSCYNLQNLLETKSPFMSEEIYNQFSEINKFLIGQITAYEYFGPIGRYRNSTDKIHREEEMNAWKRTDDIKIKHKDIVNKIRKHLNSIEDKS
jgi:hypothetical protein